MAVGDWNIDPSVKGDTTNVTNVPEGHPRRCQSKNRWKLQCQQWARKGDVFCRHHAGRGGKAKRQYHMTLYGRRMSAKFKDILVEHAKNENRTSIDEEIDVARVLCEESIGLVDAVFFSERNEGKASDTSKLNVIEIAQKSLTHVAALCERMAKINALGTDTLDPNHVDWLMLRVVRIIEETLVSDDHKAQKTAILKQIDDLRLIGEKKSSARTGVTIEIK